jgi:uncharacterized protein YneF (UPF0154 family)
MSTGAIIGVILGIIFSLIVGGIIGAIICSRIIKKNIAQNPPINKEQIKALYSQMGRKPSESQLQQVMNSYKNNANKKK